MKKGIFGTWFKELATLIFTQTIQAFLLAIVMAVIISAMSASGSGSSTNYAAGLLAIIALSQFGKIEMLVKQIFGVTSQFGDPGSLNSGKSGIVGAGMAIRGVKRVGDNFGKAVGGAAGAVSGQVRVRSLEKQRDALKTDEAKEEIENSKNRDSLSGGGTSFTENEEAAIAQSGNGGGLGISSADITKLVTALNNNAAAVKSGTPSKADELDAKIEEAKGKRNQSLKNMVSGVAETGGAIVGATAGAVTGLATGDGAIKGAGIGAGVGDWAGQTATNLGAGAVGGTIKAGKAAHKVATGNTKYQIADRTIKSNLSDDNVRIQYEVNSAKENYNNMIKSGNKSENVTKAVEKSIRKSEKLQGKKPGTTSANERKKVLKGAGNENKKINNIDDI